MWGGVRPQTGINNYRANMAESVEQTFRDHLQRAHDTLKHCGIKDDQIVEKLKLCEEGIMIDSGLYARL